MKTKLIKQDITVRTDEDIIRALLDGYVLKTEGRENILRLAHGEFIWTEYNSPRKHTFRLGSAEAYAYIVYKEEPVPWYEAIPEHGILCWVEFRNEASKHKIQIITYYNPLKGNVLTSEGLTYDWAVPVTLEEIKQYILKEENHDS